MDELSICVYSIAKNESKFVNRFMDALEGQIDKVYILDTGSSDDTVELFKKRGAIVHKRTYKDFKFDKARNDSLSFVPLDVDVCVCLDIDDVVQPGFADSIRKYWIKGITKQMRYEYYYTLDENDNPIVSYYNDRIHTRNWFKWIYPIHELLQYTGNNYYVVTNPDIIIFHRPDNTKSRAFYLDMLEERVKEYPDDNRNTMFLARNYLNKKRYDDSLRISKLYLNNKNFNDKAERSKIMFFMAKSYRLLKLYDLGLMMARFGIEECPKNRDNYVEGIINSYYLKEYKLAKEIGEKGLLVTTKNPGLINDGSCFNGTLEDYLSLTCYKLGEYDKALEYIDLVLKIRPNEERLLENKELYLNAKMSK